MLNTKGIKIALLASSLLISSSIASTTMAAEPGALNYPAGSSGTFIGEFPPIPGLFMVSQTSFTTSDALHDKDGDEIKADDFNLDVWAQTFRIVASYPNKLWGANLYSQLVIPIVDIESSLSVATPFGNFNIFDDSDSGLGNITVSPLIMSWVLPESHQYFTLGLDVALKGMASYDANHPVNAGTGYSSIIPVLAYRYDKPDGLDIGVKVAPMFSQENSDTNYETGDMLAVDFTAGWNFGKWKVGVVGGYTDQWEADRQNGAKVADSEMRSLAVGPSIMYSAGPMIIAVNYQKGVLAENTTMTDSVWLNFTLPLYVPEKYRPKH